MDGYDKETYGERIADDYDDWAAFRNPALDATVDVLTELAGAGTGRPRALELAIGTGRIALPLAAAGVDVTGVDASPAMVDRLRAKPGGAELPVVLGDFADVPVEGTWPLVFVAFSTFFALGSQEAQLRCFANVAAHLEPGGAFVAEVFVPDLGRFDRGQSTRTERVGIDRVDLFASVVDPVAQTMTGHQVVLRHGEPVRLNPVVLRWAFPAELDLMARMAGLELAYRWAGWDRSPFSSSSGQHVSVWVKP